MPSFSPRLQLDTLFVLDGAGRIRNTREPHCSAGPGFTLIRDRSSCAWAVNVRIPSALADSLNALACMEPPLATFSDPPRHAAAYLDLLGGRVDAGPVFTFPTSLPTPEDVVRITMLSELEHHFRGWTAAELPERSPILGVTVDGEVVSVCFCARRSRVAAEAGVDTAAEYRGRGFGSRVTAAWGRMIRESGRLPLYSTSWDNAPSLALARRLGLSPRAVDWSVYRAIAGGELKTTASPGSF